MERIGDEVSLRLLMADEIGSRESRGKNGCQERGNGSSKMASQSEKHRDECLH